MKKDKLVRESLNEEINDRRLRIYFNRDGSFDAIRDFVVYHFYWNPATYKIYSFNRLGVITDNYVPGELLRKPHIQMILQVQRNINSLE